MFEDRKVYNILVIEDNAGDFALVEDFLSEQVDVFTLLRAKNFRDAKEILVTDSFKFDVILLDISLPDKTGVQLINEIVALSENTPVIVLTGYSDFTFSVRSLALGISDYMLKDDLTPAMLYKSIIYSSERKKTTLALADSENQYSELFHLSPQPMWVFETDSLYFLDVNNAAIKHYGYTREEFLSMTVEDISGDKEGQTATQMPQSGCTNSEGISVHKKKDGRLIQVDIQGNDIEFKGKRAKIILATDVTERLNYIKGIETRNEKLSEISWMQSHLVRAPLARILGLTELMFDKEENSESKEKILNYLLRSAKELDCIIKDITEKTYIEEYHSL